VWLFLQHAHKSKKDDDGMRVMQSSSIAIASLDRKVALFFGVTREKKLQNTTAFLQNDRSRTPEIKFARALQIKASKPV
jgi:hypothetical protein